MSMSKLLALPQRVLRHLFLDHSYADYYSAEIWEQKYRAGYELNATKEDGRYGALVGVLLRYQGQGPILDAGCGDGLLEEWLRRSSDVRMVGIDYASSAIEAARGRNIPDTEFVCADYRSFVPREKYNAIVLNEALYYIDDYLDVLRVLSGHLAEDGLLVISMFETLVTARIWKALRADYELVQGVSVRDEASGQGWRIRVLRPRIKMAAR